MGRATTRLRGPVHVRQPDQTNANSNGQGANGTIAESGRQRQSTHLKSKDTNAAGPPAEGNNSVGKKLANDDDFTVPSVLYSGMPPHSSQEKLTLFPTTSPCKSVPAKYSSTDKRRLEGMDASDVKSKGPSGIKEKEPVQVRIDLEDKETTPSFQVLNDKTWSPDPKLSSHMDRLKKQHAEAESYQIRTRNENAVETQSPPKNGVSLLSKPYVDRREQNGDSDLLGHGLRETGVKRKRSHHDVEQNDDLSDSSVESLPGMEISPDDVVSAIGPKHFWKARRAIVNQQRVFAVQVFELHRLIKVQKLIAASPHVLIEGDPCLGKSLAVSKKRLAGDVETQLESAKNDDGVRPTQLEHSKEKTEANQPSPSQDEQAATNGDVAASMHTPSDNKQKSWCIPAPPSQWLIPVMSPSEGLVYKPYTGHCPPVGSLLAPPFFASYPTSSSSTAGGDFMSSACGARLMSAPVYFPSFSMPAVSGSAVEQVSHVAASQHKRNSCSEAVLASRDSEVQGSSASSPASSETAAQPRVIRVVPHTARTASESAARIFRSIQMERKQNDP
uniref:Protein EARLY FLOWERING 3 n=1 Tax=Zea mays TaxID=4577 RepID=A0A804Q301_MAIZE